MARQVLFIQGAGDGAHRADAALAERLRIELGPGYGIRYPAMPNEDDPDLAAWKEVIADEVAQMGEDAVLVAHSAGAASLVLFLANNRLERKIGGVFLIAAPFFGEGGWQVDGLTWPEDLDRRFPDAPVFLYQGSEDAIVPIAHLDLCARALPGSAVRRLSGRDHQLNNDMTEVARDMRDLA
jgi:uncharacterized protein